MTPLFCFFLQAASAAADSRQNEIVQLLERDRNIPHAQSTSQAASYRRNVETILGAEENVYRVAWVSHGLHYSCTTSPATDQILCLQVPYGSRMHFQLLGKDEVLPIDEFVAQDRWQAYMAAYMAYDETPGIEKALFRPPYLRRSVDESLALENRAGIRAHSGMGVHFCLRTLRKFFVKGGEDWFVRKPRQVSANATAKKRGSLTFREWHQTRFDSLPARDPTPPPSPPPPQRIDAQTVPEAKPDAKTDEESAEKGQADEKTSTATAPAEPTASGSVPTSEGAEEQPKSSDVSASASATAKPAAAPEPTSSAAMDVDEPTGGSAEVKASEEMAKPAASGPVTTSSNSAAAPTQSSPA